MVKPGCAKSVVCGGASIVNCTVGNSGVSVLKRQPCADQSSEAEAS